MSNSASVAKFAADTCATGGLQATDARGAPYPVLLGLGAGAHEYAARVRELLDVAGIDALMVCYVDRLEGDPEGVLAAISAVSEGSPSRLWHRSCAPTAGCPQAVRACRTICSRSCVWRCSRARPNVAHGSRGRSACARYYPGLDGTAARGDLFSA